MRERPLHYNSLNLVILKQSLIFNTKHFRSWSVYGSTVFLLDLGCFFQFLNPIHRQDSSVCIEAGFGLDDQGGRELESW
jgi:hypothetical protein